MNASLIRPTASLAAAILMLFLGSIAPAATLESITISPPALALQPCETATLEIVGHYDDGPPRDLSDELGLIFSFEVSSAARTAADTVMGGVLDDELSVTLDDVDSEPVSIQVVSPEDLSLCRVVGTSTTTSTSPSDTSSTATTFTSSTLRPPTTIPGQGTTSTTFPPIDPS